MAKIDIGLRQAHKLANLPPDRRTAFIAEGLPILLESARGLYAASQVISDMSRESSGEGNSTGYGFCHSFVL